MPLVWAHAEYVKLLPCCMDWRESWRWSRISACRTLRVELPRVRDFTREHRPVAHDDGNNGADTGLGIHAAALPVAGLPPGGEAIFTWRYADGIWRGQNFNVAIIP